MLFIFDLNFLPLKILSAKFKRCKIPYKAIAKGTKQEQISFLCAIVNLSLN